MALSVSIAGKPAVACDDVVLFDNGVPIAMAANRGGVVVFADALRDSEDLAQLLAQVGIKPVKIQTADFTIEGSMSDRSCMLQ